MVSATPADRVQHVAAIDAAQQALDAVRDRWRASGLRQAELAELAGISRPTLANVLQGTFGLSPEAAARLRAVVASLPVVQAALW